MHKYQLHIAYNDKVNTAASKAVQDCRSTLSEMGYTDCSIEDIPLTDKFYRIKLISRLLRFLFSLKENCLVAVQYPLLSGNAIFKYFIKIARLKGATFFCVIHDLDDLRYKDNAGATGKDINALNYYDYVIAHTPSMTSWLKNNGIERPVITLQAFDYLSVVDGGCNKSLSAEDAGKIVFAGNLSKSKFIYALDKINKWKFTLYGPNYAPEKADPVMNICWNGVLSPDEILTDIHAAFGLIWDGEHIDHLDTTYGNYLKYNYPHKLSLYLAAGLPVIAPRQSAIGNLIAEHGVGILINNLLELQDINIAHEAYNKMRANARKLSFAIRSGHYLVWAVTDLEEQVSVARAQLQTNPMIQQEII